MIEVADVVKWYGPIEVLRGVNLAVSRGEVAAIIGPSGSGKSTFLRCLNGLETFHSGSITIDGLCVSGQIQSADLARSNGRCVAGSAWYFKALTCSRTDHTSKRDGRAGLRPGVAAVRPRIGLGGCWIEWGCPTGSARCPASFRVASNSVLRLPGPWPWSHRQSCLTSPQGRSIRG